MFTFLAWLQLLTEEEYQQVPQEILQGYEREFEQAIRQLVQRTTDPSLKKQFQDMLDCPIRDARGNCRRFAEYILSALIRNGVHQRYEIEGALLYVFQQMMLDRSPSSGQPRPTLFSGFDPQRSPDARAGLQARFMSFLKYAINNIVKGKIRRLSNTPNRPAGTVSIGQGRPKDGDVTAGVSADQIAARPSSDADMAELIDDITDLLKRKEPASGLPLIAFFRAMMSGMRTDQQAQQFGDRRMRLMRTILKTTVQEYARTTGNYRLLYLLSQFEGFRSNQPMPTTRAAAPKAPKPVMPTQEKDFRSIVSVVSKFERPVGTADLGRFRRRWLEYAPRTPGSSYRNRLEEVLEQMVRANVLIATPTPKGAVVYSPGPKFDNYR